MNSQKNKVETIPQHLAIIMDGNRRWARKKKLASYFGHQEGYKKFKEIADACLKKGIKILTVYAFSTENWRRSKKEVNFLMKLLESCLDKEALDLQEKKIKVKVIGRREDLPPSLQKKIEQLEKATASNKRGILNLAISYGGRDEILRAVNRAIQAGQVVKDEASFSRFLDTAGQPDPDLIIRTGGQGRLSNFLLWQAAYSELYFTDTFWPDFTIKELDKILSDFARRQRNFGA